MGLLAGIPLAASAFTLSWFPSDSQIAASSYSPLDRPPEISFIVDDAYIQAQPVYPWKIPPPKPPFKVLGESAYPTAKRIFLPGDMFPRTAGQCVSYIKYHTGLNYSGNAIEWVKHVNSEVPIIGSVIVLDVNSWGHMGIVIGINNNIVTVRSRNWRGLWIVSDDQFDINDTRIMGYIDYER